MIQTNILPCDQTIVYTKKWLNQFHLFLNSNCQNNVNYLSISYVIAQ